MKRIRRIIFLGVTLAGIVVGGAFASGTAGQLDPDFGNGGVETIQFSASAEPNEAGLDTTSEFGKPVVVGYAENDNEDAAIAVLHTDGTFARSFSGDGKATLDIDGGDEEYDAVTTDSQGRIVVAGTAENAQGSTHVIVARYLRNGSLDSRFGDGSGVVTVAPTLEAGASDVTITRKQRIVVAGYSSHAGHGTRMLVGELGRSGNPEVGFGDDGVAEVKFGKTGVATAVTSTASKGKVTVGGVGGTGGSHPAFARLDSDGTLDRSFGDHGRATLDFDKALTSSIYSINSNRFVASAVVGRANRSGHEIVLAQYSNNGMLDKHFGDKGLRPIDLHGSVGRVAPVQAGGKIVVAASVRGEFALLRFKSDGTRDMGFSGNGRAFARPTNEPATALGLAWLGRAYLVAGISGQVTGSHRFGLAQFLTR